MLCSQPIWDDIEIGQIFVKWQSKPPGTRTAAANREVVDSFWDFFRRGFLGGQFG